MSDVTVITVAIVGGITTLVNTWLLVSHGKTIARVEHNTNGMQKTIEKLAFQAGQTQERDKEKR